MKTMCLNSSGHKNSETHQACCESNGQTISISRRGFLGGMSAVAGLAIVSAAEAQESEGKRFVGKADFPAGKALRILPVLVYQLESPKEMTSWRSYGDLREQSSVEAEARHIEAELKDFSQKAEFPVEILPVVLVNDETKAKATKSMDADMLVIYAAGAAAPLYAVLAESKASAVMFVRHKTKPYYLYHEIAHWRFLRRNEDAMAEPNMDTDDIAVDDYNELLWRARAIYGLKNAKGTKMLAIGSLAAYSEPAQKNGPVHAKEVWNYEIEIVPREDFLKRLNSARADKELVKTIGQQAQELMSRPNITMQTKPEFVVNSFMALHVCRELLKEKQAFNFGFDFCMGREVIEMLGTPPCLVLAMANDEGYTAYCHTDLSHTFPGVLMRWITGKPTFLCNTHFPHDGIFTVAHCAAPMRMNGKDYEPATIMTHYESDYGAATRVAYPLGQQVTVVMPNLHCTKWQGFRGKIAACPTLAACRSQIDIEFDGDIKSFTKKMEGFHAQLVYGDYLREVGYALKKLKKVEWQNFSET